MLALLGALKHCLMPTEIGSGVTTHVFRTSAQAHSRFSGSGCLPCRPWFLQASDSGWFYAMGNYIKLRVASVAIDLGGNSVLGIKLGNRFKAISTFVGSHDVSHS